MVEFIKISEHDGKMEGIHSISTSVLKNPWCQKNATIKGAICQKCYAQTLCDYRGNLAASVERNQRILTSHILKDWEIPNTWGDSIFRFEAFGDLNNEIQLENYIRITKDNPDTRFTLYTKRYKLVSDYFRSHPMPENFTLILSSLMVNRKINMKPLFDMSKYREGQIKTFTVYDLEYIKAHPELKINCGSKSCVTCRRCYEKTPATDIREILKKDQSAAETVINWRNPDFVARTADRIEEMLSERMW